MDLSTIRKEYNAHPLDEGSVEKILKNSLPNG